MSLDLSPAAEGAVAIGMIALVWLAADWWERSRRAARRDAGDRDGTGGASGAGGAGDRGMGECLDRLERRIERSLDRRREDE